MAATFGGQLDSAASEDLDIGSLPTDVKRRLDALHHLQFEHTKIRRQFLRELTALEKKFHKEFQPLYDTRADIVAGKVEPTDEQATLPEGVPRFQDLEPALEDADEEEEEDEDARKKRAAAAAAAKAAAASAAPVKGIPNFWRTALLNHPQIADLITDQDEEVLAYLVDIKLAYLEDNPGFALDFVFEENPFFTNTELRKTYYLSEPTDAADQDEQFMLERTEATPIQWKQGKDLTVKVVVKKQRHVDTQKTRVVRRTTEADSFFNFFKSHNVSETKFEEGDEENAEKFHQRLDMDYQVGDELKEKVLPQALRWFTGDAADDFDYGMDDEDFDEEDFDDEDDEDEDDEDDE